MRPPIRRQPPCSLFSPVVVPSSHSQLLLMWPSRLAYPPPYAKSYTWKYARVHVQHTVRSSPERPDPQVSQIQLKLHLERGSVYYPPAGRGQFCLSRHCLVDHARCRRVPLIAQCEQQAISSLLSRNTTTKSFVLHRGHGGQSTCQLLPATLKVRGRFMLSTPSASMAIASTRPFIPSHNGTSPRSCPWSLAATCRLLDLAIHNPLDFGPQLQNLAACHAISSNCFSRFGTGPRS